MDRLSAEPFIADDSSADLRAHTMVADGKALSKLCRLIPKPHELGQIREHRPAHHPWPPEQPRGNAWNPVEPKEAQLADVDRSQRHTSEQFLRDEERGRPPELHQPMDSHADSAAASSRIGDMCR